MSLPKPKTRKKAKKAKMPLFYSLDAILEKCPRAKYYIIFGERSNGKTHSVIELALREYLKHGWQLGIIRRYEEDFLSDNAMQMMDGFVNNQYRGNIIDNLSNGKWNDVRWYKRKFYLTHRNEQGEVDAVSDTPFAHTFYLSGAEHKKATSYPLIHNVLFDEFLTNNIYLINEFKSFLSIISTIVRLEDYVRIFMCGNTVSQYCPYFADMGLTNIKKMEKGTIDIYRYGNSGLEIAVEYADFPDREKGNRKKKSDVYFAFSDSPTLKMITQGDWETNLYPHLPTDYHFWDIEYQFYIQFDNETFECELIIPPKEESDILPFVYIHRKTTPLKDELNMKKGYYTFKTEYDNRPYFSRNLLRPRNRGEKAIARFFKEDRVFYQDNLLGETIRRYIEWCSRN